MNFYALITILNDNRYAKDWEKPISRINWMLADMMLTGERWSAPPSGRVHNYVKKINNALATYRPSSSLRTKYQNRIHNSKPYQFPIFNFIIDILY